MTKECALYLIAAHGCRVLDNGSSMLVIVNERINFQFSIALFELLNVKAFGFRFAVNDHNLEVMRGDVFGFLGPNGSGKTTTIRMLLGLIQPASGSVFIFGLDTATHLSAILARLGAFVEAPVFYPYLSGTDNLRRVATASGMCLGKSSLRRIDEVLEMVDLRKSANQRYQIYSLDMKQRLGINAALLTDPELVILDEPTLAGYVKEKVVIRYDPVDLAEIWVLHQERFVCRAICQELAGSTISLKEIEKARSERRKQVLREKLGKSKRNR